MNSQILARMAAVIAILFIVQNRARADDTLVTPVKVRSITVDYKSNLQISGSQDILPIWQLDTEVPDLYSAALILGNTAKGQGIDGCGQRYNPQAETIMLPLLKCGEHVAVTEIKADGSNGKTLELVNIGQANLGIKVDPKASVISMTAARKFGFDPDVPVAHSVAIRKLKSATVVATLRPVALPESWPLFAHGTQPNKLDLDATVANLLGECGVEICNGSQRAGILKVMENRLLDPQGRFGESYREVVYQKTGHVCQFSWLCISRDRVKVAMEMRSPAARIVRSEVIRQKNGLYKPDELAARLIVRQSTFYHAPYVDPHWKNVTKTAMDGKHIFYTARR